MFNIYKTAGQICSPRALQHLPQSARPFLRYNVTSSASDCQTPRTPRDWFSLQSFTLEMQKFHQYSSRPMYCTTPKSRYANSEHVPTTTLGYDKSPLVLGVISAETEPKKEACESAEDPEEDARLLLDFIERLRNIDTKNPEFLSNFSDPEEAIRLVECLREILQEADEGVRNIMNVIEKLPSNLLEQVDLENLGYLTAVGRSLSIGSRSKRGVQGLSNKLGRFKIRTVDVGGVVKEETQPM